MFSSIEQWRPVVGLEKRYEVSDQGQVRSVPFMQRYTHWRSGAEMFRQTKSRILSLNLINSGYQIINLYRDNKCFPSLVHRLVAEAFLGVSPGSEVNHVNGFKTDNRASNLEWVSSTNNKLHAVGIGLNTQAVAVIDPATGIRYDSISQAAAGAGKSHRKVSATFIRDTTI